MSVCVCLRGCGRASPPPNRHVLAGDALSRELLCELTRLLVRWLEAGTPPAVPEPGVLPVAPLPLCYYLPGGTLIAPLLVAVRGVKKLVRDCVSCLPSCVHNSVLSFHCLPFVCARATWRRCVTQWRAC